ncbi:MAG: hypothetical protein LBR56_03600 [Sporomusaceae bacterium]|jgi:hypothetical protein|nr:hypothetical protein [Sporomusaceae bacterium]
MGKAGDSAVKIKAQNPKFQNKSLEEQLAEILFKDVTEEWTLPYGDDTLNSINSILEYLNDPMSVRKYQMANSLKNKLIITQGNNHKGYLGTCGIVACANVFRLKGYAIQEREGIKRPETTVTERKIFRFVETKPEDDRSKYYEVVPGNNNLSGGSGDSHWQNILNDFEYENIPKNSIRTNIYSPKYSDIHQNPGIASNYFHEEEEFKNIKDNGEPIIPPDNLINPHLKESIYAKKSYYKYPFTNNEVKNSWEYAWEITQLGEIEDEKLVIPQQLMDEWNSKMDVFIYHLANCVKNGKIVLVPFIAAKLHPAFNESRHQEESHVSIVTGVEFQLNKTLFHLTKQTLLNPIGLYLSFPLINGGEKEYAFTITKFKDAIASFLSTEKFFRPYPDPITKYKIVHEEFQEKIISIKSISNEFEKKDKESKDYKENILETSRIINDAYRIVREKFMFALNHGKTTNTTAIQEFQTAVNDYNNKKLSYQPYLNSDFNTFNEIVEYTPENRVKFPSLEFHPPTVTIADIRQKATDLKNIGEYFISITDTFREKIQQAPKDATIDDNKILKDANDIKSTGDKLKESGEQLERHINTKSDGDSENIDISYFLFRSDSSWSISNLRSYASNLEKYAYKITGIKCYKNFDYSMLETEDNILLPAGENTLEYEDLKESRKFNYFDNIQQKYIDTVEE